MRDLLDADTSAVLFDYLVLATYDIRSENRHFVHD
jgi:hypothetical protein